MVFSSFFGKRGSGGVKVITRYTLTPLGQIKAEAGDIPGEEGEIASVLTEDIAGKMTKREIVNQTKLPESEVGLAIKKLIRMGYVKEATGD